MSYTASGGGWSTVVLGSTFEGHYNVTMTSFTLTVAGHVWISVNQGQLPRYSETLDDNDSWPHSPPPQPWALSFDWEIRDPHGLPAVPAPEVIVETVTSTYSTWSGHNPQCPPPPGGHTSHAVQSSMVAWVTVNHPQPAHD